MAKAKSRSTSLPMFSLARERFEQAAAKLAASDGKIDHDMLNADEMVVVETYGPAAT
jgi:hypothetical protein